MDGKRSECHDRSSTEPQHLDCFCVSTSLRDVICLDDDRALIQAYLGDLTSFPLGLCVFAFISLKLKHHDGIVIEESDRTVLVDFSSTITNNRVNCSSSSS